MEKLKVMCSRTGRGDGAHHIVDLLTKKTLCGRDAADWYNMDTSVTDAAKNVFCCERCAKFTDEGNPETL